MIVLASSAVALWAYLTVARGQFWRAHERDDASDQPPAAWPRVVAVVPARDEAESIAASIRSLLAQDYLGEFSIVLVDDQSRDDTSAVARATAQALGCEQKLDIVTGSPLPSGWTGKVWAQHQGITRADESDPSYLLLTDADIVHAPDTLRWLVAHAQARGLTLTS
ncbi:MAG: glycosyltransferase, partial [Xanthobacteraceae bacterium]